MADVLYEITGGRSKRLKDMGDGSYADVVSTTVGDIGAGIVGFGKLALTSASTLLSTLTVGPNSAAWPALPGIVDIQNDSDSAGLAYICPLGGTCTSANGIPLPVGGSFRFTKPATAMTMIAVSTATIRVQF